MTSCWTDGTMWCDPSPKKDARMMERKGKEEKEEDEGNKKDKEQEKEKKKEKQKKKANKFVAPDTHLSVWYSSSFHPASHSPSLDLCNKDKSCKALSLHKVPVTVHVTPYHIVSHIVSRCHKLTCLSPLSPSFPSSPPSTSSPFSPSQ